MKISGKDPKARLLWLQREPTIAAKLITKFNFKLEYNCYLTVLFDC